MEPIKLAPGLILIKKGTHKFDFVNQDGLIARYHQVTSSVVLYLGKQPTVIDSGARVFRDEIERRINEFIEPSEIEYFIATHYHHDHLDNSNLFKNAIRILDTGYVTPQGVMTVFEDPSLIPTPDGIEIFGTPGHVKNHISTKIVINGKRFVCAGDAVREDILSGRFKPHYVNDQYVNSVRRIYDEADLIIPGHGELIEVDKNNLPPLIS